MVVENTADLLPRNITLDLDNVFSLGDVATLDYLGVAPIVDVLAQELETVKDVVRTEMESALELKVPLKSDMSTGDNWLECK